jgi:hypothetical protein
VGSCALFLSGTKSRLNDNMKTIDLQTSGDIHLRLMKNQCPRCEGPLKVTSKTENRMERLCDRCNLTIVDHIPGAEYPDEQNVCD